MRRQRDEDDYEAGRRWAAQNRSYITPAIITMVLYCVFWVPGLIANIAYLSAANTDAHITGRPPQGMSCLGVMFGVFVVGPLIIIGLTVMVALFAKG